jgi:hypothetical protein
VNVEISEGYAAEIAQWVQQQLLLGNELRARQANPDLVQVWVGEHTAAGSSWVEALTVVHSMATSQSTEGS